jgi:hypothetical protein
VEEWIKIVSTVGFPIAACVWMMRNQSDKDAKNEARADAREKGCEDRIRQVESYVREDLSTLIDKQGACIDRNTVAMEENTRVIRTLKGNS